ncbi:hypothetical protein RND71_013086 [Anisodus tanguticus]|uniref:Uncharacterized protein n=1 Tax=Anisodus tanguticus TaxID=243964 RepID=A0AAE1VQH0_9SOLA|nr:hypothetical protein RND71_013086 [Anisodus tanguticus]
MDFSLISCSSLTHFFYGSLPGANALSGNANGSLLIGQLSYLCEQIVANLKTLKPLNHNDLAADGEDSSRKLGLPEATLQELLRKCLFLSSHDNNQLMKSALVIAQMMERNSFIHKLNKLCSLSVFDSEIIHSDLSTNSSESFLLSREEDSLRQAAQKLELIMRRVVKGNNMNTTDTESKWVVAKTWKACPIGMLPHAFGSTGLLPILDFVDDSAEVAKSSDNEFLETYKCGCKREAAFAIECLNDPNMKKMRKTQENMEIERDFLSDENAHNNVPLEGSKGLLMIDGVWKKVSNEELRVIAAALSQYDIHESEIAEGRKEMLATTTSMENLNESEVNSQLTSSKPNDRLLSYNHQPADCATIRRMMLPIIECKFNINCTMLVVRKENAHQDWRWTLSSSSVNNAVNN